MKKEEKKETITLDKEYFMSILEDQEEILRMLEKYNLKRISQMQSTIAWYEDMVGERKYISISGDAEHIKRYFESYDVSAACRNPKIVKCFETNKIGRISRKK